MASIKSQTRKDSQGGLVREFTNLGAQLQAHPLTTELSQLVLWL